MTQIAIHGILSREVGSNFSMQIGKAVDVFDAIDANRPGFIKKINELSSKGFNYTVVVDGKRISNSLSFLKIKKPQKIDIVPIISGSGGGIVAAIGAVGGWIAANQALVSIALFVVSTAISILLQPKQKNDQRRGEGTEATTRGLERSFEFSNKQNIASQGAPVPVGYGRLKVGSQVVQACIKTFPQNVRAINAMKSNPFFWEKGVAQSDDASA